MNSWIALLVVATTAGIRLKVKQDNKSSSFVEHLERDDKLLDANTSEKRNHYNKSVSLVEHVEEDTNLHAANAAGKRKQHNKSVSVVELVERDGKLLDPKDAEKPNEHIAYTSLLHVMPPHPTPDSWPTTFMYAAELGIVIAFAFILTCCAWCICVEQPSVRHVATPGSSTRSGTPTPRSSTRSGSRSKTLTAKMIDDHRLPLYLTYWELDGNDPECPWNPTEQGGTDGVQLAIVKEGKVQRIPTDGICTQQSSVMHKSKEWHQLNTKTIHVVNYTFEAIPSAFTANQYREQYGVKELDLGRTVWGKRTLAVGAIFETFHRMALASNN